MLQLYGRHAEVTGSYIQLDIRLQRSSLCRSPATPPGRSVNAGVWPSFPDRLHFGSFSCCIRRHTSNIPMKYRFYSMSMPAGPVAAERLVVQSTAVALKRSSSTAKAEVADYRSHVRTLDNTIGVRGVEIGHVKWGKGGGRPNHLQKLSKARLPWSVGGSA
jgi:hypothetical protein